MVVSVVRIFFDKTETTDTTIWKPGFKLSILLIRSALVKDKYIKWQRS